jgi:hypothetical protein
MDPNDPTGVPQPTGLTDPSAINGIGPARSTFVSYGGRLYFPSDPDSIYGSELGVRGGAPVNTGNAFVPGAIPKERFFFGGNKDQSVIAEVLGADTPIT